MNSKLSGNMRRKLAMMFSGPPDARLVIGLHGMTEIDTGSTTPGSLRVYMEMNGVMIVMSPKKARDMADIFEGPLFGAETIQHKCEWIPQTLRQVCDEIDARVARHN